MISLAANAEVFICTETVDFRKGIDGLAGVCKKQLGQDPFSGALFVFINRSRQSIKILFYDGQGFWIYHKRLSSGRFLWWPEGNLCKSIAAKDLSVLIYNGNPEQAQLQADWR